MTSPPWRIHNIAAMLMYKEIVASMVILANGEIIMVIMLLVCDRLDKIPLLYKLKQLYKCLPVVVVIMLLVCDRLDKIPLLYKLKQFYKCLPVVVG